MNIPFENDKGKVKDWSLIAGNNGAGKTTLLRSLALGLCDVPGAGALILELDGGILRDNKQEGSIEVCLTDKDGKKYKIKTTIKLKGNSEVISQKIIGDKNVRITQENENGIRNKLFVVGYGAGRSITGSRSYDEYAIIDSVYSLFNYGTFLQNAELAMRRIKDNVSEGTFAEIKTNLKKILMLDKEDKILLKIQGLYFQKIQWGERSFNTLSDGYKSLTTVIMDFLHWKLLYESENSNPESSDLKSQNQQVSNTQEKDSSQSSIQGKDSHTNQVNINNLSGIFIIDEIEQHLHPKWQRRILKILSEQFPNIQFIATTHTPICVLGLNDLECESQLIKAGYENSHSEVSRPINMKEAYKGYRVDQILTSPDIFDLTSSRSQSMENKLKEYRVIYLKDAPDRTNSEKQRMQELEQELKDLPMWDTVQDRKTIDELTNLLDQKKEVRNDKN